MNYSSTTSSRLFGRRKGRPLRAGRARLMDELLPKLKITLSCDKAVSPQLPSPCGRVKKSGSAGDGFFGEGSKGDDGLLPPARKRFALSTLPQGDGDIHIAPSALFNFPIRDLWMEVGFGGGEHLAEQAAAHPDVGFIGCEPFVNGVASLLCHIEKNDLKNVRIYPDDARHVLDALPEASLGRCFVLFADPWPKKRHAERRFIGRENLDRLARALKPGAELRLATDAKVLEEWMREQVAAHDAFECVYDGPDAPADWVPTRYEQKARAAGRGAAYFIYRRR